MDSTLSSHLPAGIGLRHPHIGEMQQRRPQTGFLEVHAENYMNDSSGLEALLDLGRTYPVSLHCVGLSLASASGLEAAHLSAFGRLIEQTNPTLVSAHLAWSTCEGVYLNDLLPLPYTSDNLAVVRRNIDHAQQVLGRRLLVENLSAYIGFKNSEMTEAEFLARLVDATGCGLLLDVNNVFVSAHNLRFVALDYLRQLPVGAVGQYHLAGHAINDTPDGPVLIDDHGSRVPPAVWDLYRAALRRFGAHPTLVEWDTDVPPLDVLLGEAHLADATRAAVLEVPHARAA